MKKSSATALLLAGAAALAWWWWRGRAGAGGKDVDAADADKGVQIGQAGSNIGLTGDQVGSLFDKILEQTAPYDQVRYFKNESNNRHYLQVRYGGEGDWINVADAPETQPLPSIPEFCALKGLRCRP